MPLSVSIGWVLPSLFNRDRLPVQDDPATAMYFGHSVPVTITQNRNGATLYWYERSSDALPGEPEPLGDRFIDMYPGNFAAPTFRPWRDNTTTQLTVITDIPARRLVPAGYRWLDIVVIVHETATNQSRGAYFRQYLLNGQGSEQLALAALTAVGVPDAALEGNNFTFSVDRAYAYVVEQNNVPITDLAATRQSLTDGTFVALA
jgi:hypothetical protein